MYNSTTFLHPAKIYSTKIKGCHVNHGTHDTPSLQQSLNRSDQQQKKKKVDTPYIIRTVICSGISKKYDFLGVICKQLTQALSYGT